ncbi:MAG: hypothetical protein H7223_13080 [Pedobacter sp.]|nr:hypothetical protein [Pedobacter sp.]
MRKWVKIHTEIEIKTIEGRAFLLYYYDGIRQREYAQRQQVNTTYLFQQGQSDKLKSYATFFNFTCGVTLHSLLFQTWFCQIDQTGLPPGRISIS